MSKVQIIEFARQHGEKENLSLVCFFKWQPVNLKKERLIHLPHDYRTLKE
jgi:hypothetical protein